MTICDLCAGYLVVPGVLVGAAADMVDCPACGTPDVMYAGLDVQQVDDREPVCDDCERPLNCCICNEAL